jgi:hypothetical protein
VVFVASRTCLEERASSCLSESTNAFVLSSSEFLGVKAFCKKMVQKAELPTTAELNDKEIYQDIPTKLLANPANLGTNADNETTHYSVSSPENKIGLKINYSNSFTNGQENIAINPVIIQVDRLAIDCDKRDGLDDIEETEKELTASDRNSDDSYSTLADNREGLILLEKQKILHSRPKRIIATILGLLFMGLIVLLFVVTVSGILKPIPVATDRDTTITRF